MICNMASINNKLRQIKDKFLTKSVRVDDEWLNGCVQWFLEEEPSISFDRLYEQVNEQWLLSDLADSGMACIPPEIFNIKQSQIIDGTFQLQLQCLINIAEPAYDQLQVLYNKEIDEPREQEQFNQTQKISRKKRVLRLTLFDGTNSVAGMEYLPIPALHTKLSPGTKMILKGPMRCVNHILFLEAKNIQILGGELELLSVENAYENVLLRALNKPINPKPRTNYAENEVIEITNKPTIPTVRQTANTHSNRNQQPLTLLDELGDDDDIFNHINIEQIANTTSRTSGPLNNIVNFSTSFEQNDRNVQTSSSTRICNQFTSTSTNNTNTNLDLDLLNDDDSFDCLIQSHAFSTKIPIIEQSDSKSSMSSRSILSQSYTYKIRGCNLVTIDQLKKCTDVEKFQRTHFIIKGEIKTIVEVIRVTQMAWTLGVLLTDNHSNNLLQVKFSSEVLSKLAGATPTEINEMKIMRKSRPQIDEDLSKILKNLTQRLEMLTCFMKLEYKEDSQYPIVIEIVDSAPVLENILKKKLENEKTTF